jgi:hypothetical protein
MNKSQNYEVREYGLLQYTYGLSKSESRRITLSPSQFKGGAKYAKEHGINNFFIVHEKTHGDSPDFVDLDLSWLEDLPETFEIEIMPHPSANSDVDSLYKLNRLTSLRYCGYDKIPLNHHRLQSLKDLYTFYDVSQLEGDSSFENLPNLNYLTVWCIKKQKDCAFLGNLPSVKSLDLCWGSTIESLSGVEKLVNLEYIDIGRFPKLTDISPLLECKNLKEAFIESSRQLNPEAVIELYEKGVEIRGGSAVTKILAQLKRDKKAKQE